MSTVSGCLETYTKYKEKTEEGWDEVNREIKFLHVSEFKI